MSIALTPDVPDDPEIERIADALAGPGWCVSAGFLAAPRAEHLIAEAHSGWQQGEFRRARVGIAGTLSLRPEVRRDQVLWIDPNQARGALGHYLARIEALRQAVNRRLYLGLFEFEGHFARYEPGDYYRRHLDQFEGVQYRQVSCVLYLNPDWGPGDGGELRLYLGDGTPVDVIPRLGTLVVFLSGVFEHEVLPTARARLSLTGWLRQRLAALP